MLLVMMHDEPKKNENAKALGRLGGLKGGAARAKALGSETRSEIAKKAADARWGNAPKAKYPGELKIGTMTIPCAVLSNGLRVLSQRGFYAAVAQGNPGAKRENSVDDELPTFLTAPNLKPFISAELALTLKPIIYRIPSPDGMRGGGTPLARGIDAKLVPDICDVWLKARDAGALHNTQRQIAAKAEILMRGLAKVGIIALVDECTGYQADRQRDELAKILEAYIAEELRPYIRMFPHEFFKQVHRLWGWPYKEGSTQGPRYVGKIVNTYVYKRLPPGVHEELLKKNPSSNGQRKHAHHQWLTEETGVVHLDKQISAITTLMVVADDKAEFDKLVKKRFPKSGDQLALPTPRKSDEEE